MSESVDAPQVINNETMPDANETQNNVITTIEPLTLKEQDEAEYFLANATSKDVKDHTYTIYRMNTNIDDITEGICKKLNKQPNKCIFRVHQDTKYKEGRFEIILRNAKDLEFLLDDGFKIGERLILGNKQKRNIKHFYIPNPPLGYSKNNLLADLDRLGIDNDEVRVTESKSKKYKILTGAYKLSIRDVDGNLQLPEFLESQIHPYENERIKIIHFTKNKQKSNEQSPIKISKPSIPEAEKDTPSQHQPSQDDPIPIEIDNNSTESDNTTWQSYLQELIEDKNIDKCSYVRLLQEKNFIIPEFELHNYFYVHDTMPTDEYLQKLNIDIFKKLNLNTAEFWTFDQFIRKKPPTLDELITQYANTQYTKDELCTILIKCRSKYHQYLQDVEKYEKDEDDSSQDDPIEIDNHTENSPVKVKRTWQEIIKPLLPINTNDSQEANILSWHLQEENFDKNLCTALNDYYYCFHDTLPTEEYLEKLLKLKHLNSPHRWANEMTKNKERFTYKDILDIYKDTTFTKDELLDIYMVYYKQNKIDLSPSNEIERAQGNGSSTSAGEEHVDYSHDDKEHQPETITPQDEKEHETSMETEDTDNDNLVIVEEANIPTIVNKFEIDKNSLDIRNYTCDIKIIHADKEPQKLGSSNLSVRTKFNGSNHNHLIVKSLSRRRKTLIDCKLTDIKKSYIDAEHQLCLSINDENYEIQFTQKYEGREEFVLKTINSLLST